MIESVLSIFAVFPPRVSVFFLSMVPIIELRGALPVALEVYRLPLHEAYLLAVVGNMIPALFVLYTWDWFIKHVERYWPWLHRVLDRWHHKTEGRWNEKIEKYGPLALIAFVAIPLPGSGAWTGALVAWIFTLKKSSALIAIFLGVLIAGALIASLTNKISGFFV